MLIKQKRMKIEELANNYHHSKISLNDEKIVLFQNERSYKEFIANSLTTEQKLRAFKLKDEIEHQKQLIEERENELLAFGADLLEALKAANIEPEEKVEFHIRNNSYFDVWYDINEITYSSGPYSKM